LGRCHNSICVFQSASNTCPWDEER
jgi:hypothetical protein